MDMHQTFVASEEWRAAHANEVEFINTARALRSLAAELGEEPESLVAEMTERGLPATLTHLAQTTGSSVDARFLRCRAIASTH